MPPENMLKAILCDLDGTLVDTSAANYAAYAAAMAEIGVEVDRASFDAVAAGRNWRQFLPQLLRPEGKEDQAAAVAARKQALYPHYAPSAVFNTALWLLLRSCRPTMKTALVTTASRGSVKAVLQNMEVGDYFDCVITGDDVDRHKPAPDAYLLATEKLGIVSSSCIAIEDSEIGIKSAVAAGISVLHVGSVYQNTLLRPTGFISRKPISKVSG